MHHWDADGIASAAHVLRVAGGRVCRVGTPDILEYSASAIHPAWCGDTLLVLDYGIPLDEYGRLHAPRPVLVIDHHRVTGRPPTRVTVCNPVAGGGSEDEWPSTSYLLYRVTGLHPDLALVGVMGDRPDAEESLPGIVDELSSLSGVEPGEARLAAELLDSCYRRVDERCVLRGVRLLAALGVGGVTGDEVLRRSRGEVESEYHRAISGMLCVEGQGIVRCRVSLVNPLHTMIGRRLATENPSKIVILVASVKKLGDVIVYVRSSKLRPGLLLDEARRVVRSVCPGATIGGKDRVFAVERLAGCNVDKVVSLLEDILRGGMGA